VADDGDEEKETLIMLWMDEGNSESNKKDGMENTKKHTCTSEVEGHTTTNVTHKSDAFQ
jgi:hypothetical protein